MSFVSRSEPKLGTCLSRCEKRALSHEARKLLGRSGRATGRHIRRKAASCADCSDSMRHPRAFTLSFGCSMSRTASSCRVAEIPTARAWLLRCKRDSPSSTRQPLAAFSDTDFRARRKTSRFQCLCFSYSSRDHRSQDCGELPPLHLDGRIFAHNGVIGEPAVLERHLGADASRVRGDTDSERYFALVAKEIRAHQGDVRAGSPRRCAGSSHIFPRLDQLLAREPRRTLGVSLSRDRWPVRFGKRVWRTQRKTSAEAREPELTRPLGTPRRTPLRRSS